jgi:hypothetical protein
MSNSKDPRDPQPIFTDVKAQCHVGSFLTSENLLHNRKTMKNPPPAAPAT